MGADVVIAVDISNQPRFGRTKDSIDMLRQAFTIMGQSIARFELVAADIVIRPDTGAMRGTDFDQRHQAIMEGEKRRGWRR